jgi:hypothetical protein
MKIKKKDVKRIQETLDEMLGILEEIRTPQPRVEDDYRWATKLTLDLRALHLKAHGEPPGNMNLDPETVAGILTANPNLAYVAADRGTDWIRLFGMKIHQAAPGRSNWEMW